MNNRMWGAVDGNDRSYASIASIPATITSIVSTFVGGITPAAAAAGAHQNQLFARAFHGCIGDVVVGGSRLGLPALSSSTQIGGNSGGRRSFFALPAATIVATRPAELLQGCDSFRCSSAAGVNKKCVHGVCRSSTLWPVEIPLATEDLLENN